MKVSIVHPLKHHVFHSINGIKKSSHQTNALLGMYDKQNIISNILKNTKYKNKFKGYRLEEIDEVVQTNLHLNLYFLAFQKYKSLHDNYVNFFDRSSIRTIKKSETVHVLQDYCSQVIKYAYNNDKKIVYEQIQPISYTQRFTLLDEIKNNNFSLQYVDNFFPEGKIQQHIDNMKMATHIHTASELSYQTALEIVGEDNSDKISLWPYGVNPNMLGATVSLEEIENKEIEKRKIKVLYIGSISLIKGIPYLLEVIHKMESAPIEFTIIGTPRLQEDQKLIKRIEELENVKYLKSVPNSKIGAIYKENDIFIFPALMEGFGMVTLEAMTYGLPCIVNKYCQGVVTDNMDGFIVNPQNSEEIINSLEYFLENPDELKRMSINAYNNSQKYTWKRYSKKWSEFYNTLM